VTSLRTHLLGQVIVAVLAVTGGTMIATSSAPQRPPRPADQQAMTTAPLVSAPPVVSSPVATTTGPAVLGRSVPVRLDIPAISVHTGLVSVGLNADGSVALPPPRAESPAGWYQYLASPGETGTAVIFGHVDTARDGPAVFYRLGALRAGDRVSVDRADGSTAVFTVSAVAEYPKIAFPAVAVYGAVGYPVLRLITCGGTFDRAHRSYRDNIVVYAELTGAHPSSAEPDRAWK
jgi:hypothetical protein